MRYSVSDTAEYGDYTAGPRIINEQTRETMRQILREVQDGTFARKWIKENETGREWFEATREKEQQQKIEKVGEELRAMMTFLDPVTVKQTSKRTKVPA
jgi:ketol-acid reductoisomerase